MIILNFPRLHKELVKSAVPEGTIFLATALEAPAQEAPDILDTFKEKMPLSPKEILLYMAEIKERGAELWSSGQLAPLVASSKAKESVEKQLKEENAALASFTSEAQGLTEKSNEKRNSPYNKSPEEVYLEKQQLLLYMAMDLEKSFMDSQKAEQKFREAEKKLSMSLHSKNKKDEVNASSQSSVLKLPFEKILKSLASFAPPKTIFLSTDKAVKDKVKELKKDNKVTVLKDSATPEGFEIVKVEFSDILSENRKDKTEKNEGSILIALPLK